MPITFSQPEPGPQYPAIQQGMGALQQQQIQQKQAQPFQLQQQAAQLQAQLAQQHARLQQQLSQTQLTQTEQMQLQRMQNAIGAVNANDNLSDEEKKDAIMQLQTHISPLQQRHTAAQTQALQLQQHQAQQAAQFNQGILDQNRVAQAGSLGQVNRAIVAGDPFAGVPTSPPGPSAAGPPQPGGQQQMQEAGPTDTGLMMVRGMPSWRAHPDDHWTPVQMNRDGHLEVMPGFHPPQRPPQNPRDSEGLSVADRRALTRESIKEVEDEVKDWRKRHHDWQRMDAATRGEEPERPDWFRVPTPISNEMRGQHESGLVDQEIQRRIQRNLRFMGHGHEAGQQGIAPNPEAVQEHAERQQGPPPAPRPIDFGRLTQPQRQVLTGFATFRTALDRSPLEGQHRQAFRQMIDQAQEIYYRNGDVDAMPPAERQLFQQLIGQLATIPKRQDHSRWFGGTGI
jgi:hypothetical protein